MGAEKLARGGFFTVQPAPWSAACALGINEAVAYLVLAQGTAGNNKTTSWSAESLDKYTGMRWARGKAAIERLITAGLLRYGASHTPKKPRYEFTSVAEAGAEWHRANLAAISDEDRRVLNLLQTGKPRITRSLEHSITRLTAAGLIRENGYRNFVLVQPLAEEAGEPIWLPNTLVTGTAQGEIPPIKRLRQNGDIWALRLLVDLYSVHNLRDDGGIRPSLVRQNFEKRVIGQAGLYTIWAFKPGGKTLWWEGVMKIHHARPKAAPDADHPVWTSQHALENMGLVSYVPHIWDNNPGDGKEAAAEIIHPYGIAGFSGEAIEISIANAAHEAALRAVSLYPQRAETALKERFYYFCPIRSTIPNACMIGVARLRYRPHTARTGTWATELEESSAALLYEFGAIAAK